jgi:hypothetical protein
MTNTCNIAGRMTQPYRTNRTTYQKTGTTKMEAQQFPSNNNFKQLR